MALFRGLSSLSRASGLLRSSLAKPSARRFRSVRSSKEEEFEEISKGTWESVARILAIPAFAAYAFAFHIKPALDEGVPEGVHVFTWLIARCLMTDIREEERIMDAHMRKMRDIADDYLIARDQDIYNTIPMIMAGTPKYLEKGMDRTLPEVEGPDGF